MINARPSCVMSQPIGVAGWKAANSFKLLHKGKTERKALIRSGEGKTRLANEVTVLIRPWIMGNNHISIAISKREEGVAVKVATLVRRTPVTPGREPQAWNALMVVEIFFNKGRGIQPLPSPRPEAGIKRNF